ncbi:MAG: hypothetical protein R2744_06505 [Bacteroidales bacterium]
MRIVLLLLTLSLVAINGRSSEIKISGVAGGNSDSPVTLYRFSDPVSLQKVPVASTIPGGDGRFIFLVENRGVNEYFIINGIHENHFFVDGSNDINLVLHPYEGIPPEEKQNPFFEAVFVYAGSTVEDDFNNLIIGIENQYRDAIESLVEGGDAVLNIEPATAISTQTRGSEESIEFLENWIRYREASLYISGTRDKVKRGEIIRSVEKWFDPSNRSCTELVNDLLGNFLREMSVADGGAVVRRTIELGSSAVPLREFASDLSGYSNPRLIEYVLVMNLYRENFSNYFDREGIVELLGWMMRESIFEYTRNLAGILEEKISRFTTGSPLPPFSLKGPDGEEFTQISWRGKFLLLSFGRSDSWMTASEYNILSEWKARYSEYLEIVTILCDDDFVAGCRVMAGSGYDWLMLDGSGNSNITQLYDVRFFPSFCLADPDGNILISPAPFPSENLLQVLLEKLRPYLLDHLPE